MKITFNELEPGQRGNYRGCFLKGTKENGEAYSTFIFDRNKALLGKLKFFKAGDVLDLVMEQNGQYWNVKDVNSSDAAPSGAGALSGDTSYKAPAKAASSYRSPEDQNHSAAVMTALTCINTLVEAKVLKLTETVFKAKLIEYSQLCYALIKGKDVTIQAPTVNKGEGIPKDALPPEDDVMGYSGTPE